MDDRYNIFLEVQRGGWDSRKAIQKQNPKLKQFGATNWANAFDLIKVYGAGWLGEAGTAFGRNAAFVPTGSIFKRITNTEERGSQFGVEDLYAAYRLQAAADAYGFGRKAKQTRRQTRFLFYMVVIELLKGLMIRAGMPVTPRDLTEALLKLFQEDKASVLELLLDTGATLIDDYMTRDTEDCIFEEPAVMKTGDIAAYLKGERLGKTEEDSPHFRSQIGVQLRVLARGGATSPREQITAAIN